MIIQIPPANLPRIAVIGGGFAGIEFCKQLDTSKFQLVLFDRNNFHTFQPLLYQVATAGLEPSSIAGPLRKLFEKKKNFYFRMGEVLRIHPEKNCAETSLGNINYDYLVIATGTKTSFFGHDENYKEVFPLKELPHSLSLRNGILRDLEEALLVQQPAERQRLMNVVVAGAGPTGVEVAGALSELRKHVLPRDYPELDFSQMNIYLIEGTGRVLSAMSEKSSEDALLALEQMGIEVILNMRVVKHDGVDATLDDGTAIPCRTLVWAAGVTGSLIPGLPTDATGRGNRIVVNEFNQVKDCPNIFAIGDIAVMKLPDAPNGHPQLAPVAMQQGVLLAKNLERLVAKEKLKPFKYSDKGTMATIGRNKAVVDLPGNIHLKGFLAWLAWMALHLIQLIGFRSRLIVLINWIWSYITYDRSIRLILKAKK